MLLRHHDKDMSAVYDMPVTPLVDSSAARTVYHLGGVGFLWRCDYSSEQRQGQN
jgi:hypothetical protein